MSSILRCAVALCMLVFSVLTPAWAQNGATDAEKLPEETLVIRSGVTDHRFVVEVAATDRDRARGLMFREEMAADHGMLFVFEGEGDRYFWMKNTPLPLDIIFIGGDGGIVSIAADTTPFSEAVIPSKLPAKYVLEVNAGTAASLGVKAGDKVSSPSMKVR